MAVKSLPTGPKSKTAVHDYWKNFQTRIIVIFASLQIVMSIVIFGTLEVTGITDFGTLKLAFITVVVALLTSVLTILSVRYISRPFKDLVDVITRSSKTPEFILPPDSDNKQYQRDGFVDILQTVYELTMKNRIQTTPFNGSDSAIMSGFDETPTGIVIFDADSQIVYKNQSAPVRTNTDEKFVLDVDFPDSDTFDDWLVNAKQTLINDEHHWIRVADKLPGESGRRVFDIVANFNKGSNAEVVVTLYDRSESYTPEDDEFDFISFAAHELRGPITVIRGYLDVLNDELGPMMKKDQAELMQRLVVSSNRLSTYVNNILNAARFDRRHMKLHLTESTVRSIYLGVADDMELRASSQNRLLSIDIPETLPTVASDNNSMSEVFSNLIDNAIKYSNEGGLVNVVARPIPGFVEISVVDRGIGMPTNVMPNLFHKFYRSHRSRETVAGTGIGLYICKAIVSSHGGSITAQSVENEGSKFSFTLPIYDTVAEKLKASDNSNQSLIEHGGGWIRNHTMYRG